MGILLTILFIYLVVGIYVAWFCLLDDMRDFKIIKFNYKGVMTLISLGILWPSTVFHMIKEARDFDKYRHEKEKEE